MGLAVKIREIRPGEEAFIYSGWINTQRRTPLAKTMKTSVFAKGLHRLIERLLKTSNTLVAEYQGKLVGFACFGGGLVHYVFVGEPYRGKGVARRLLEPVVRSSPKVTITHEPEPWRDVKVPSSWVYDPWAAWLQEETDADPV